MKVLIVDDNDVSGAALDHYFTLSGWRTERAGSAEDALERISSSLPDAIILDHVLPGMDGEELFHELRRKPATLGMPVVLLTAVGDAAAARLAELAQGLPPCQLHRKPADPQTLLDALEAMTKGN